MFCNLVNLMRCYKLNTLPVHHRHTAMNLCEIIRNDVCKGRRVWMSWKCLYANAFLVHHRLSALREGIVHVVLVSVKKITVDHNASTALHLRWVLWWLDAVYPDVATVVYGTWYVDLPHLPFCMIFISPSSCHFLSSSSFFLILPTFSLSYLFRVAWLQIVRYTPDVLTACSASQLTTHWCHRYVLFISCLYVNCVRLFPL